MISKFYLPNGYTVAQSKSGKAKVYDEDDLFVGAEVIDHELTEQEAQDMVDNMLETMEIERMRNTSFKFRIDV